MSQALTDLRAAVEASPENLIVRIMLIRGLTEAGELSEALSLALRIPAEEVTASGDRDLMSGLFRSAGMSERAAAFSTVPGSDVEMQRPVGDNVKPDTPPGQLRLVGGSDAETQTGDTDAQIAFADVGGLEQVKKDIRRRIILPFAQPGLLAKFKKSSGGGVLLYGPPGCGKTLLARATAGECGARFLNTPLSEILSPYPGESERRLSALFAKAREDKPTVLFFDEIEALAAKRSSATHSHVGQLISHFLTEFDGINSDNTGVLILAATNTPWAVDGAFLRPGRFDRMFFVPPPDKKARASIFNLELVGRPGADTVSFDRLAAATAGLSGAEISGVVEAATDAAIDATLEMGQEVPISQAMLEAGIKEISSGVGDWLATAKDYATYANESGRYDEVLDFIAKQGRRW